VPFSVIFIPTFIKWFFALPSSYYLYIPYGSQIRQLEYACISKPTHFQCNPLSDQIITSYIYICNLLFPNLLIEIRNLLYFNPSAEKRSQSWKQSANLLSFIITIKECFFAILFFTLNQFIHTIYIYQRCWIKFSKDEGEVSWRKSKYDPGLSVDQHKEIGKMERLWVGDQLPIVSKLKLLK
jgi:hypothetical protein